MSKTKASGSVDMTAKAKQADITVPVVLSKSLVEKLRPNQFLMELGISFDKRIANLFEIVQSNLEPSDEEKERSFTIPLIMVNGPIVSEDILSPMVRLQKNDKDEQTIFITDLQEPDSEIKD